MKSWRPLFFALVLALWATLPAANAYDFSGDTVYIDDDNVFLAAYPHTFSLKDCEFSAASYPVCTAYFMLKTKVGGAGFPISAYWGFNTEAAVPIRAEIWNGTEWKPWETDFSKIEQNYDGKNRWYNVNATVDEGIEYLVRVYIRVKDPGYAKYDFAIKPRDETFQESVAAGHFYLLDPWYNVSYIYRRAITAGNAALLNPVTLPIAVNSTVFYPNTTYYQVAWCNFTVTNTSGTVGWLYYSNATSYECINSTHTGSTNFMDVDEGNRSGFGSWPRSVHAVLHMNTTDLKDKSSYGRLVQKFGTPGNWTTGKIGNAIDFDGTGDYYNVTAIDPPIGDADRSVVAWINPDICASEDYIFYYGKYSAQKLWGFSVGTNCILEVYGYDPDALSIARVTINEWTFVAVTYNSSASQLTFFVNGTRELETVFTKNYATESTGNYSVGCGTATTTGCFNGKIDELRFYNRTLSDDEVYAMYYGSTLGTEGTGAPVINISSPGNISYKSFTIPLTWDYNSPLNSSCNWSAYSLDGAANVSTSCMNGTVSFGTGAHNITVWANDSSGKVASDTEYFTANFAVGECSGGGYVAYNFTFYDEEVASNNLTALSANISIAFTVSTPTADFVYNTTQTNVTSVAVCTDGGTYTGSMMLEYFATEYTRRYYFFDEATIDNTTHNIQLYLLSDTIAVDVGVTVQDAYTNPLPGAVVQFQRYYPGENLYRTVAVIKSDDRGTATVSLTSTGAWFRYAIYVNGILVRTIGPSILSGTSLVLSIASGGLRTWQNYNLGISRTCGYASGTGYFSCNITDPSGLADQICLKIYSVNVMNNTLFNSSCKSGNMTLVINVSNAGGYNSSIVYILYIDADNDVILEQGTVNTTGAPAYGTFGLIVGIFIFLVAAGMGKWNPAAAIITGTIGIICAVILTFLSIPIVALGSLIIVAIIIAYKVKT